MKTAQDYPVTTKYGYVKGYPLNGGYHHGEDRAMPEGTPILVNNTLIGYSGNTGASTGPHLHIGRWLNGGSTNPQGGGFTVSGGSVEATGHTSSSGNWVRVKDSDGSYWVYLHLSKITAKAGEELNGMYNGKTAEEWANEAKHNLGVAQARRRNSDKMWNAGGVDPQSVVDESHASEQVVKNIDAKNKEIVELQARIKESSEFNAMGRALVALIGKFGYKK